MHPAVANALRTAHGVLNQTTRHFAEGGDVNPAGAPAKPNPLAASWSGESGPGATVSARPGKVGGRPFDPNAPEERREWSPAEPNLLGATQPPPMQEPVYATPRQQRIHEAMGRHFKSKHFHQLIKDMTGLEGVKFTPVHGSWNGQREPSFHFEHPGMTHEHAATIGSLLGFGMGQDAVVNTHHHPAHMDDPDAIPTLLVGHGKKFTQGDLDKLYAAAGKRGMDFSTTKDGKAAKFLHFGDVDSLRGYTKHVKDIAAEAGMPEFLQAYGKSELIHAKDYQSKLPGLWKDRAPDTGGGGLPAGATGPSDLFRRTVDHLLVPHARAAAGEGYRLSADRLADTHNLTPEQRDYVRQALYPEAKADRSTIPLMEGKESLDIQPTGARGKASVGDALFALQNRAAQRGQIDPGDYSDRALKTIAKTMADETEYHVKHSAKSAIGWYDRKLKEAENKYSSVFPEIKTDPEKRLLFRTVLGITSQGADVFTNSINAARMYKLMRGEDGKPGLSLPDAVKQLKGSFGGETRAIEMNLHKLHHLMGQFGAQGLEDLLHQKKSVSEWNKMFRSDPRFKVPGMGGLQADGQADQKVSGWNAFGPKIGSFINNLNGDYSTLTSDLWFSRTWNRMLGYNFEHSPTQEGKQYRDFKDALVAEHLHHPMVPATWKPKTSDGKIQKEPWEFGRDAKELSDEDMSRLLNDPDEMQRYAREIHERYYKGGYKEKSDLRRRAKNWMENRENPVAQARTDLERDMQQRTAEEAQRMLKKRGHNISIADIQAALWFHEKELFTKLGVTNEKAEPADYVDAANHTLDLIGRNKLFSSKAEIDAEVKAAKRAQAEAAKAALAETVRARTRRADGGLVGQALRLTARPAKRFAEGGGVPARRLTPQGFYSGAAEAAQNLPQQRGTMQQMGAMLQKQGAKPAELANTGFDFSSPTVADRSNLAQHFNQRLPQIRETEYWDSQNMRPGKGMEYANKGKPTWAGFRGIPTPGAGAAQYAGYVIPGGQNYRELLLHAPADAKPENNYKSSHWPVPNVLAHLRMSEREEPPELVMHPAGYRTEKLGKRGSVLHLEELQSDWRRDAHEYATTPKRTPEEQQEIKDIVEHLRIHHARPQDELFTPDEVKKMQARRGELAAKLHPDDKEPPKHPYIENQNGYIDLGLKRALIEAARGGHGRLAWTPDAIQRERYPEAREGSALYDKVIPNRLKDIVRKLGHEPEFKRFNVEYEDEDPDKGWGYAPERHDVALHSLKLPPELREKILQGLPAFAHGGAVEDEEIPEGYADGGAVDPTMPEPRQTQKAYKLFRQKNGQLYPLFVNADKPVPMGQWLRAEAGPQGKAPGKVKSKLGDLAYRPGWHSGDLPIATHIGGNSTGVPGGKPDHRPDDQVWAEVEHPADVNWQAEANRRARITKAGHPDPKTAHITDQVPHGGFYRYKTNANMTGNWLISGGMRVNRILPHEEVKAINARAGLADLPRLHELQQKPDDDLINRALRLTAPVSAGAGVRP